MLWEPAEAYNLSSRRRAIAKPVGEYGQIIGSEPGKSPSLAPEWRSQFTGSKSDSISTELELTFH
jgi:hypothetical protein